MWPYARVMLIFKEIGTKMEERWNKNETYWPITRVRFHCVESFAQSETSPVPSLISNMAKEHIVPAISFIGFTCQMPSFRRPPWKISNGYAGSASPLDERFVWNSPWTWGASLICLVRLKITLLLIILSKLVPLPELCLGGIPSLYFSWQPTRRAPRK